LSIFDATLFKNKTGAESVMSPITRIDEAQMSLGDFTALDNRPAKAPVYMDAENLDDETMLARVESIHYIDAGARVGTYAVYPKRNYWDAIADKDSAQYQSFVDANKLRFAAGKQMDIIMPSLYTFYTDQVGWNTYATENIREARKYGREIMPFIWFDYHDSAINPYTYIGDDYWRAQIKLCLELTGNAIVWGGWDLGGGTGAQIWDDEAAWFKVVQEFL